MYSKMSPQEIKEVEVSLLEKLVSICEEHNLTYLLAYGTCLGAVRHGGFIPWDDDVDIFMPREDYERLYTIASNIEEPYKLCCYRDGSSYHQYYKFTDTRTVLREAYVDQSYSIGLWVDVFPLDRVDSTTRVGRKDIRHALRFNTILRKMTMLAIGDPKDYASLTGKLAKLVLRPIARLINPFSTSRKVDEMAMDISRKYGGGGSASLESGEWAMLVDSYVQSDNLYSGDLLFPPSIQSFEGREFCAPNKVDEYLSKQYGNWKQIPPQNERRIHFSEAYWLDSRQCECMRK